MIPREWFMDAIDDGRAFRIESRSAGSGRYEGVATVGGAAQGLVTVEAADGSGRFTPDEALVKLNMMVNLDPWPGCALRPQSKPFYDTGTVLELRIATVPRTGGEIATRSWTATILHSDTPIREPRTMSVEATEEGPEGRSSIRLYRETAEGPVEIMRLTRRGLPRDVHGAIAAIGGGWTGSPDPRASMAEIWGEDALARADSDFERGRSAFEDALMGALKDAKGGGAPADAGRGWSPPHGPPVDPEGFDGFRKR